MDIHKSGLLLLSIINDILDLSKIEAGRMELYRETVEMWDVMEACRRLIAGRAEDAGLVVTVVWHDPGPLTLQADPTKIKQVLLNLLSNAIKFTPRGGQDHHIHRMSSRLLDKTVGCRYRHRHDGG